MSKIEIFNNIKIDLKNAHLCVMNGYNSADMINHPVRMELLGLANIINHKINRLEELCRFEGELNEDNSSKR